MKTRALAILAMVWAGCSQAPGVDGGAGGGDAATGGGAGGGAGGITLAGFCAAQQAATCAKEIRCGAAAPGADCQKLGDPWRGALISARADCLPPALRANIAAGITRYDAARAQQCLDATQTSAACAPYSGFTADPSCDEVFPGTVAAGGTCYGFNECGPGLVCDSTQSLCPGTCRPRVQAGEMTTNPLACELGLLGSFLVDGGIVCVGPVAAGQTCLVPGWVQALPCSGTNSCQSAGDGGLTCLPLKTAGMPCVTSAFVDCALDSICAGGSDGGTQCVALRRSGESCDVNLWCQAGLACVNAVCGPLVAKGGNCSKDSDCVAGSLCKAGSCQPFGELDAGCNTGAFKGDCAVGLFCNSAARCEKRRGAGEVCTGAECDIELGLSCDPVADGGVSRCRAGSCARP